MLCQLCCGITCATMVQASNSASLLRKSGTCQSHRRSMLRACILLAFVPLHSSSMTTPNTLGCLRGFGFQVFHLLLKLCGCAGGIL